MNDDHDLESRLRAGARAFPPAPAPDRAHLRHVLTTSRRRSRRTQGGVLVCATAAVAGGVAFALREPRPTETLEVAAPDSTTIGTITPTTVVTTATGLPAPSMSEYLNTLCVPNFLEDHTTLLPHDEDTIARAHMFLVTSRHVGPFPVDLAIVIDGRIVFSADPDHEYESPPPDDRSAVIMYDSVLDPPVMRMALVRTPFDPTAHEIAITAGGQTAILDGLVDGLAPVPDLDAVEVEFGQFDRLCAKYAPTPTPTPAPVDLPPATELSPTTVGPPPASALPPAELSPTTVELPPASDLSPTPEP